MVEEARSLHWCGANRIFMRKGLAMQKKRYLVAALGLLLVPALAMAQKVTYDFDKAADFTTFKRAQGRHAWLAA